MQETVLLCSIESSWELSHPEGTTVVVVVVVAVVLVVVVVFRSHVCQAQGFLGSKAFQVSASANSSSFGATLSRILQYIICSQSKRES